MRKYLLGSILMISSLFTFTNTANANSVQDEINRTNQLIGEYEQFERKVVNPEVQKYQRYLNRLYMACMNGNRNACNLYTIKIQQQNERLERATQIIRNRRRY
ncbi:hypothetical protein NIES4071_82870 [Calothrix sp. NIES-4071]|nr:hypothetical protein NIES4071_82870 [Calothrix sp. NIES-4071]BAZ62556.1 hypothetical protein NIES4105_82800 [Calothrix sp. NIES-4105]